jgi:hypothetical protein
MYRNSFSSIVKIFWNFYFDYYLSNTLECIQSNFSGNSIEVGNALFSWQIDVIKINLHTPWSATWTQIRHKVTSKQMLSVIVNTNYLIAEWYTVLHWEIILNFSYESEIIRDESYIVVILALTRDGEDGTQIRLDSIIPCHFWFVIRYRVLAHGRFHCMNRE